MSDTSPYGSQPKADGPEWFQWDQADILSALPPFASYVATSTLGLSNLPVNVHDFCRLPPPTELATTGDIIGIASGGLGWGEGAYRRFGNIIRARKWAELCEWTPPPVHVNVVDPPDGYTMYYQNVNVSCVDVLHGVQAAVWISDPLPKGIDKVAVRINSFDPPGLPLLNIWFFNPPPNMGEWFPATTGRFNIVNSCSTQTNRGTTWQVNDVPHIERDHYLAVFNNTNRDGTETWSFDIAVHWPAATPYVPPDPIAIPPEYPTTGGECDTTTLADLCRAINGVQHTADAILDSLNPPGVVVDPTANPVVPTDDAPPDGPKPTKPLPKPPAAIGALIVATSVPNKLARYGTSPTFYPDLGHVAQITKYGPLPSILIKHSPMVIMPVLLMVESIQLDLSPDVEASVSWIYPPTVPVPPPILPGP